MFLCTVLIVTSLASYPGWAQDQGKPAGTLHAGVSLSDPMQPTAHITQIRSDPMQPLTHITQIRSDLDAAHGPHHLDLVQTPAYITQ